MVGSKSWSSILILSLPSVAAGTEDDKLGSSALSQIADNCLETSTTLPRTWVPSALYSS